MPSYTIKQMTAAQTNVGTGISSFNTYSILNYNFVQIVGFAVNKTDDDGRGMADAHRTEMTKGAFSGGA